MLGFLRLLTTLFPDFISVSWVKGGHCLAFPIFRPLYSHTSSPLHGQWVGIAWLSPPFDHPFPTLHTYCLGIGWAFLTTPTFRPSFPHPSYLLPGHRVGIAWLLPPFGPPFPHPSYLLPGHRVGIPGFSHLSTTLSPPFIPIAWVKGGLYLAFSRSNRMERILNTNVEIL